MFHHAVGHREVRRGVVELDVAGEGRLAREDDGRGEDCEDCECGAERPQVRTAAPDRPEQQSRDREPGRERRRQLGRRVGQRRELAGEDDERQPEREHERSRQALARGQLDQPSAAEREPREDERENDPGDEQGQRLPDGRDAARRHEAQRPLRRRVEDLDLLVGAWKGDVDVRRCVRGVDRDAAARRGHALLVGLLREILQDLQRVGFVG